MLNNVIDGKETFFRKKNSIFQSPKNRIFPKGLTHAFNQKCIFFLELFSVKIRPDIMLVCEIEKKAFLALKKCNLSKSQKSYFSMILVKK